MDDNNRRANSDEMQVPGQATAGEAPAAPGMDAVDWRTQLHSGYRQTIVNLIMDILKRDKSFSGQERLEELKETAVTFEEEVYTGAMSKLDYLKRMGFRMQQLATKIQTATSSSVKQNQQPSIQQSTQSMLQQQSQSTLTKLQQLTNATIMQQNLLIGKQNNIPEASLVSLDSSAQTENENDGDWQEEIYQKIRSMYESYYLELNELYWKMAVKLQEHDSVPRQPKNERFEKLRYFKVVLENIMVFLRTTKNEVQPNFKEKIVELEKKIPDIISKMTRNPVSSMHQGQLS